MYPLDQGCRWRVFAREHKRNVPTIPYFPQTLGEVEHPKHAEQLPFAEPYRLPVHVEQIIRVNRTGFIGGLFPREDGAHGTTE